MKQRLEKIDRLKEKKDEEVEGAIIKSRKHRVKIIRNISRITMKAKMNWKTKKNSLIFLN